MIVFVKADGSVQSVLPSPVYQGSSLEGSLYFVAPFPETNAVDVAFVRADGDVIGKYPLTRVTSGLPDVLDKLGTEYNVWEWQTSNADVTAYAGEVIMQFRVVYAGQTLATASTIFTVQEGVVPQPVEPSADQWDTLIELYSRLNAKVPDVFLTDIAISEPDEDNIVTVTKYYNNGTTATEEFPAGGTSFSVKSEWVKVIDFTTSAWVNASSGSGYEIAFPPSQTGYTDNKFLTSLESTETGGYSTLADTVFKGSNGSVLISATEKYGGRLVTLGGGIWGGVNVTAGSGEDSVQQVGGAKANGKQSAAFGGLRYDKQTGRTPTSADGNQSFAAGGSVHAEGDFSAVFGKDTIARQRASFAAGSSTAGMTEEEFNAFYWDSTNNTGLHGGSKNSDGEICDFTGAPYAKSFAFAAALGCDTQAKGARSFTAGDNTVAANVGAAAIGMNTNASGTAAFAEGYKTAASGEHSHAGGGQFTRAIGFDSFAHGANAEARADRSVAFGFETISASENGMAVGKQNVVRTDALFQVGNGTDYNNRRDAFVVLKDGRAKVQTAPSDSDDVVRKDDLGYDVDFPFGGPTEVRCDSTDGITVTGTMRIYLNQAKTVFHDVPNVSVEIPIFAGKNVTIDADETNKKAIVKVADIGSYGVDIGVGLPASATNGVLTVEQLALLQSSENNYIMFQHEKYYLEDKGHVEGYITYTHTGYESNTYWIKSITITVSTRAWVLNKGGLAGKGLDFDADGKLQVKAGANLSFGEDGTLNASGGGTANEYTNTSEIVDNAITLTSTSTLADLATQILAQKTKVAKATWDENVKRLLGDISSSIANNQNVLFKVVSAPTSSGADGLIECYHNAWSNGPYYEWKQLLISYHSSGTSGWEKSGWVPQFEKSFYPVGSIYITTQGGTPSPVYYFGGTWEQIKGRFLVGAGSNLIDLDLEAGATGGSANAVVIRHSHTNFTVDGSLISWRGGIFGVDTASGSSGVSTGGTTNIVVNETGVDGEGKNLPPYLAVYMWKHIA